MFYISARQHLWEQSAPLMQAQKPPGSLLLASQSERGHKTEGDALRLLLPSAFSQTEADNWWGRRGIHHSLCLNVSSNVYFHVCCLTVVMPDLLCSTVEWTKKFLGGNLKRATSKQMLGAVSWEVAALTQCRLARWSEREGSVRGRRRAWRGVGFRNQRAAVWSGRANNAQSAAQMSSCRKHLVRKHLQRIITCSCLITAAFMKEKQDILRNIFSVSVEKSRGYLLWFVKHPKPFKHTTYEKERESG